MLKSVAAILLALVAVFAVPQSSTASNVSFTAPTVTEQYSPTDETYSATVTISDTNMADTIGGYQLDLFISGTPAGVTSGTPVAESAINVTSISFGTTPSYIFAGDSADVTNNNGYQNDFSNDSSAAPFNFNEVYPTDFPNDLVPVQMTQTFGLVNISFTVAGGFLGTEYLVWNVNSTADPLAPYYNLGNDPTPISPNLVAGSISIVPEPGSIVLALLGAVGLIGVSFRRRKAKA